MAFIPVVSGGAQPVFAIDTLNGTQQSANTAYAPAGTPTNFQGPALEFYKVALTGIENNANVNGAIQAIDTALQQFCTIAIQQADTNQLSVATYPLGAFGGNATVSATAVQAIITGLGVIGTANCANAVVTSAGFKLA